MKKLFAVILVVMLLPLIGVAEVIVVIDSMSYEELVALMEKVQMALFGYSIAEGVEIPIGKYVAGKDIPAGGYILSYDGNDVIIYIKTSLPGGEFPFDMVETLESGESVKLFLDDGMILKLESSEKVTNMIKIKPFVGLFMK